VDRRIFVFRVSPVGYGHKFRMLDIDKSLTGLRFLCRAMVNANPEDDERNIFFSEKGVHAVERR
jgi:hypothetical protein